jgi:hypothetical protein
MRTQLKDYVLRIVADREQGRKLTNSEQIKLTAELYADAGLREIITTNSGSWSDVSQQWNDGRGRTPERSKIYGAIKDYVKHVDKKAKNAVHNAKESKKRTLAIAAETDEQKTERKAKPEHRAAALNKRDNIQKGDHASERAAREAHQAAELNVRDSIQQGGHASARAARKENQAMSSCLLDSRALLAHHRELGWEPASASARVTGVLHGHTTTLPARHSASIKIALNAMFARLKVAR